MACYFEFRVIQCVVPENIHIPTKEGIDILNRGWGVKDPGNSGGKGGCKIDFISRDLPEVLQLNTDLSGGGPGTCSPVKF